MLQIAPKLLRGLAVLLVATGWHMVMSSQTNGTESDERPGLSNQPPPTGLITGSVFDNGVGEEWAFVGWNYDSSILSYTLRIYTKENNVLQREVSNLRLSIHNVTGLEPGTKYSATVSAIFAIPGSSRRLETRESERVDFATLEICTGGQVFSQCSAGCNHTCDDPDPICPRICVSGCACPLEFVVRHNGVCIPPPLCPPTTVGPPPVTGIKVLPTFGTDVVLVWNPLPDAIDYTVEVYLNSNRSNLIRILVERAPIVVLPGLTPGEEYAFVIIANLAPNTPIAGRSLLSPPIAIRITNVKMDGFTVSWNYHPAAARYAFRLLNEKQDKLLYENTKLSTNSITLTNLAPGTVYFVTVAVAGTSEQPGSFSSPLGVKTEGETRDSGADSQSLAVVTIPYPITTTTIAISSTTSPRTTICEQRYQSILEYKKSNPDSSSTPLPNCDKNGQFVTTVCSQANPSECWCVNAATGEKLTGSEFGGSSPQQVPLNCDNFGLLETEPLNLKSGDIKATSIEILWNKLSQAFRYVLIFKQGNADAIITSVDNIHLNHIFNNLSPGQQYTLGVFAINVEGWSSSLSTIDVYTNIVDEPDDLQVIESTTNRLTVTWNVGITAEYFFARLLSDTKEILQSVDEIMGKTVTFSGLDILTTYTVEIRAVATRMNVSNPSELLLTISEPASIAVEVWCELPPLDVIYVLDTSRRSGLIGLLREKQFLNSISTALPPVESKVNRTRISAIKYYQTTRGVFSYNRYKTTNGTVNGVTTIQYQGGSLYTGRMLNYVRRRYFNDPPTHLRKRPEALSVTIIISLGKSEDQVRISAERLKEVTNIIAVGVEGRSNDAELTAMASAPGLKFTATAFGRLPWLSDQIVRAICTLK